MLQRALLPDSLPEMPGFEVAASYRPAGELNEVGGDFYDVIPCGERRWMLVIGDVCGKGPEAASVTALARHTLRAVSMLEPRPAAMLELLHRTLLQQEPDGQMCTVCLVLVSGPPTAVTLTVALGGHPCPLLVGPGEEAHPVGRAGHGAGDGRSDHRQRNVRGARRGADADPLHRWRYGGGPLGVRGAPALAELAAGSRQLPVRDMLELIERAAVESGGGHPHDDIALLGIRIAGRQSWDKLGGVMSGDEQLRIVTQQGA